MKQRKPAPELRFLLSFMFRVLEEISRLGAWWEVRDGPLTDSGFAVVVDPIR